MAGNLARTSTCPPSSPRWVYERPLICIRPPGDILAVFGSASPVPHQTWLAVIWVIILTQVCNPRGQDTLRIIPGQFVQKGGHEELRKEAAVNCLFLWQFHKRKLFPKSLDTVNPRLPRCTD